MPCSELLLLTGSLKHGGCRRDIKWFWWSWLCCLESCCHCGVACLFKIIKLLRLLGNFSVSFKRVKCCCVKFAISHTEVLQSLERCCICNLKYSSVFSIYRIDVQELLVPMQVPRNYYCLKWLMILFIGVSRLDLRYCALQAYWSPVAMLGKSVSQQTPLVCQCLNLHQYLQTAKDCELR